VIPGNGEDVEVDDPDYVADQYIIIYIHDGNTITFLNESFEEINTATYDAIHGTILL
jgi:hypothetical protein